MKKTINRPDKTGIPFSSFALSNYSEAAFIVIGWFDVSKKLIVVKTPKNDTIVMDTLFSKTFRFYSGFKIID